MEWLLFVPLTAINETIENVYNTQQYLKVQKILNLNMGIETEAKVKAIMTHILLLFIVNFVNCKKTFESAKVKFS